MHVYILSLADFVYEARSIWLPHANVSYVYFEKILSIWRSTIDWHSGDSAIHTNGRIPRRRTNWQTLTTGMYSSVKWYSVRSGLCWQTDLCFGDTYGISHKSPTTSTRFAARTICPGTDRVTPHAHGRVYCCEKFLPVNFIGDDRMIIALSELLINRDNFLHR